LITSKLPALQFSQLSIRSPRPADGTFDANAAERGEAVFNGVTRCSTCHVPPLFTESGWNMHTAADIGIDDFQSTRSPDQRYRVTSSIHSACASSGCHQPLDQLNLPGVVDGMTGDPEDEIEALGFAQ
jgi:cytochrome c peroxidase